jgi:hypothetical protein
MKDYEQTRDRNRHLTEQRRLEVYTKLPEYGRLDESVGELSVAQAKLLLNGAYQAASFSEGHFPPKKRIARLGRLSRRLFRTGLHLPGL